MTDEEALDVLRGLFFSSGLCSRLLYPAEMIVGVV